MQKHHSSEHLANVDKLLTKKKKKKKKIRISVQGHSENRTESCFFGCRTRRGDDSWRAVPALLPAPPPKLTAL